MAELFGDVFSDIFFGARLVRKALIDNGKGGLTATTTSTNVRALTEAASEVMRAEPDYTQKDVSLIILRSGVTVELDSDCELVFLDGPDAGKTYKVRAPIDTDPVHAAWIARGSLSNG